MINGDGSYSRDFTYIENVVQANQLAAVVPAERIRERARIHDIPLTETNKIGEIFNVAYGGNTTLNDLFNALKKHLSVYDPVIAEIEPVHGQKRLGDIPHSLASVYKAELLLGYQPEFNAEQGFEHACKWYFENLKK